MNRRGSYASQEAFWRTMTLVIAVLCMVLVWGWANSKATGMEIEKKYLVRDVSSLSEQVQHIPGNVLFYYEPRSVDMGKYELTVRNSLVIVNRPLLRDNIPRQYFRNNNLLNDFDYSDYGQEFVFFLKQDDQVTVGNSGIENLECKEPVNHAVGNKKVLVYPDFTPPTGLVNNNFLQINNQLVTIKEAEVTADIASGFNKLTGPLVTVTRSSGLTYSMTHEQVVANSNQYGLFIELETGSTSDVHANDVIIYFKRGSSESRYLACLLANQLVTHFNGISSMTRLADDSDMIGNSNSGAAVRIVLGNIMAPSSVLLDDYSRPVIKDIFRQAVKIYTGDLP